MSWAVKVPAFIPPLVAIVIGTPTASCAIPAPKSTPVGVVYRASWNDEKIITGTLDTITKRVRDQKITRTAIIIIGDVIKPKSYEYSRLYDKSFSHGFRKSRSKSSKN